jgi:hypothetical protein
MPKIQTNDGQDIQFDSKRSDISLALEKHVNIICHGYPQAIHTSVFLNI